MRADEECSAFVELESAIITQKNPDHCNNGTIAAKIQGSSGVNVQGETCPRPPENRLTSFAPLRLCRYFDNNDTGFIASRVTQSNM